KGKGCSYYCCPDIVRHIDWIDKTSPQLKAVNKEILDLSFLGISLIYDSRYLSGKSLLKKYEMKIYQLIEFILTLPPSKTLAFYYPLSFIAENSGNKELKDIVTKTYFQLEERH